MAKKSKKQENQGNAAGIDKASLKAMKATEKRLTEIYESAVRQCVNLGLLTQYDPVAVGKLLQFKDYPAVDKMLHTELTKMRDDIVSNIREGERTQWQCANAKADALVTSLAAMCGVEPSAFKGCFKHNLTALAGFQSRKIGGISLSGNVWNITKGFQKEMELALSVGIANGRSAADVAEAVRRLLNNPTEVPKLITDKFGAEVMNKAWRDLHPGRGVYRSAFKNALRLTATENNIAYMTAEHERWQQLPFVLGIKVNLSKNHNCVGVAEGKFTDICDKLQGTYPKTFKFTGWHPFCRCFATTINSSVEDMKRWIDDNEDMEDFKPNPKDVVTALPKGFTEWMKGNAERVAKAAEAGTLPYFLKDNKWAMERKKTALDIAKERHEARTPEQVKEIKDRWNERTMTLKEGNDALSIFDGMEGADVSALKHAMAHADFDAVKAEAAKLRELKKKLETDLYHIPSPIKAAKNYGITYAKQLHADIGTFKSYSLKTKSKAFKDTYYELTQAIDKGKDITHVDGLVAKLKNMTQKSKPAPVADRIEDAIQLKSVSADKRSITGVTDMQGAIKRHGEDTARILDASIKAMQEYGNTIDPSKIIKEIQKKPHALYNISGTAILNNERKIASRVAKELNISPQEAESYIKAVNGFTYTWDYEMRQVQMGNVLLELKDHDTGVHNILDIAERASAIERFLRLSPQYRGGTTYRGMSLSPSALADIRQQLSAGTFHNRGTSSWSHKETVARNFSAEHLRETDEFFNEEKTKRVVLVNNGHHSISTSIEHLSDYAKGEGEVLTSMACRYRSIREYTIGDITFIEVEDIAVRK